MKGNRFILVLFSVYKISKRKIPGNFPGIFYISQIVIRYFLNFLPELAIYPALGTGRNRKNFIMIIISGPIQILL